MADEPPRDYYAVLGVARDAPAEVVRAAGRVLLQKYHPDRNPDADAGDRTEEISVAYRILTDPKRRAEYDAELRAMEAAISDVLSAGENSRCKPAELSVRRTVGRTVYEIRFQDGFVGEHTEWCEAVDVVRSDQRLFIGKGSHVITESRLKQRVWLRFGSEERLIEFAGDALPVATGQAITLASISKPETSKAATPLVLVNRASGQELALTGIREVAASLLSAQDLLIQGGRFAAIMLSALGLLYFAFLRNAGVLAWGVSLILGVPALFGIRQFTQRETQRLEAGIKTTLAAGLSS